MIKFPIVETKKDEVKDKNLFLVYLIASLLIEQVVIGGLMIAVTQNPDTGSPMVCVEK